ncbi:peroxiredoxin-like family protein [Desulforhopalus sp. 52FAK]
MKLYEQLSERREDSAQNIPAEKHQVMISETRALKARELEQYAPKPGDIFPAFTLSNQSGEVTRLADLLAKGPVVVTFYRGGWCPYCNLELRAYQEVLDKITAAGANLVAISPELPDASLTTIEKNELQFTVLSDPGAKYAKSLGIVFTLPDSLKPIYQEFGIDVEHHNGSGQFDLPLAATFVIDTNGKVLFSDVNADYTYRAEPSEVVQALNSID